APRGVDRPSPRLRALHLRHKLPRTIRLVPHRGQRAQTPGATAPDTSPVPSLTGGTPPRWCSSRFSALDAGHFQSCSCLILLCCLLSSRPSPAEWTYPSSTQLRIVVPLRSAAGEAGVSQRPVQLDFSLPCAIPA